MNYYSPSTAVLCVQSSSGLGSDWSWIVDKGGKREENRSYWIFVITPKLLTIWMREFKPDQVQQSRSLSQICSTVHWPPHWTLKDWVCAFVPLACLKSQDVGLCAIITCVRASMTSPLAVVVQRVEGKEVGVPLNRLWLCCCLETLIFSIAQNESTCTFRS